MASNDGKTGCASGASLTTTLLIYSAIGFLGSLGSFDEQFVQGIDEQYTLSRAAMAADCGILS